MRFDFRSPTLLPLPERCQLSISGRNGGGLRPGVSYGFSLQEAEHLDAGACYCHVSTAASSASGPRGRRRSKHRGDAEEGRLIPGRRAAAVTAAIHGAGGSIASGCQLAVLPGGQHCAPTPRYLRLIPWLKPNGRPAGRCPPNIGGARRACHCTPRQQHTSQFLEFKPDPVVHDTYGLSLPAPSVG